MPSKTQIFTFYAVVGVIITILFGWIGFKLNDWVGFGIGLVVGVGLSVWLSWWLWENYGKELTKDSPTNEIANGIY